MVYEGPVRDEAEVKKSLDSIGPEVVQTLSVSMQTTTEEGEFNSVNVI